MSLHLDARQRAMLQEMGVTVWGPQEAPAARTAAPAPAPAMAAPAPATRVVPTPTPPPAAASLPAARAPQPTPPRVSAPAAESTGAALATPTLRLHAPQALYPTADPAQTPTGLGAGWLIVTESLTPGEPLGGDAGRLLDNMLRAMQLNKHPRVFLAALERTASGAEPGGDHNIPAALADAVAALQPALVLVLGHVAARAALGRTEPLGRLRAGPHQLAGCPAVVTYDPAFLLRSQDVKAAAWADLCRALAIVRQATSR
ncbi:uracil-DNA glycosylase family protein [Acidovorax sp. ACV01]|uniref:uracil-DNA glycosylase family protein n=1 Tax=Acidovorax sp. ACV01 TaxID=2769311 RepID=UPI00177FB5A9|nr:uracil-DNA glycosylase family protein [Acidovorax sp. ACV01]MBD9393153.1 hypothetical protein [Acidovorax sp. ACV01]